jgi:hypothetical protein
MATFRISTQQIRRISLDDKKTWPVDMEVWVELCTRKPWKNWDAPFYLSAEQVNTVLQRATRRKVVKN